MAPAATPASSRPEPVASRDAPRTRSSPSARKTDPNSRAKTHPPVSTRGRFVPRHPASTASPRAPRWPPPTPRPRRRSSARPRAHRRAPTQCRCWRPRNPSRAAPRAHPGSDRKTPLVGRVAPERAQHALGAGAALGARLPAALGSDHQCGKTKTGRRHAGHFTRLGAIRSGPVRNQAAMRVSRIKEKPKGAAREVVEKGVVVHGGGVVILKPWIKRKGADWWLAKDCTDEYGENRHFLLHSRISVRSVAAGLLVLSASIH